MKVFLQREVPFHALYFILKCGGAQVGWQQPNSPFKGGALGITHQILDRPMEAEDMKQGREYIQPQWVLDCFNEGRLLPVGPYAANATCPPHLSPFVVDSEEGYKPQQRIVLDKLAEAELVAPKTEGEDVDAEDVVEVTPEEQHAVFAKELAAEFAGVKASEFAEKEQESEPESESEKPQKLTKKQKEAAEQRELAKSMMSKKNARLFQKIEKGENMKKANVENLKAKKKANKVVKGKKA